MMTQADAASALPTRRNYVNICKSLAVAAVLVVMSPALRAQQSAEKILLDYFNPSVCFVTSSSGKSALGKTLWYSQAALYQRQMGYGATNMKLRIDYISLNEDFLPFTSGDGVRLIGPSLRWQSANPTNPKAQPYITMGLYAGYIHAPYVSKWGFAPSASVGVDFALGKSYTLTLDYRTTKTIEGISPDGIGLSIRMN